MRQVSDIKNVLIIGSGTLGLRIGLRCALDGFQVKMYDLQQKQLETALVFQDKILKTLIKSQQCTELQAIEAKKRILITTDKKAAVADADFMSESVTENPDLKKKLYGFTIRQVATGPIIVLTVGITTEAKAEVSSR